MIERYNEKTGKIEMIEDGAKCFSLPVFYNGCPNGDMVDAEILQRDYNPCYDKVIMPKKSPHEVYPKAVGWMFDGRHMVVDGVAYKIFDRCENQETYRMLSN